MTGNALDSNSVHERPLFVVRVRNISLVVVPNVTSSASLLLKVYVFQNSFIVLIKSPSGKLRFFFCTIEIVVIVAGDSNIQ